MICCLCLSLLHHPSLGVLSGKLSTEEHSTLWETQQLTAFNHNIRKRLDFSYQLDIQPV